MSQQPPKPLLFSRVEVRFKSNRTFTMEHCYMAERGPALVFEQPGGERLSAFVSFSEVEHIQLTPSKLELG